MQRASHLALGRAALPCVGQLKTSRASVRAGCVDRTETEVKSLNPRHAIPLDLDGELSSGVGTLHTHGHRAPRVVDSHTGGSVARLHSLLCLQCRPCLCDLLERSSCDSYATRMQRKATSIWPIPSAMRGLTPPRLCPRAFDAAAVCAGVGESHVASSTQATY